jgi:hypothetical protein
MPNVNINPFPNHREVNIIIVDSKKNQHEGVLWVSMRRLLGILVEVNYLWLPSKV